VPRLPEEEEELTPPRGPGIARGPRVGAAVLLGLGLTLLGGCAHRAAEIPGGMAWLSPLSLEPMGEHDWIPEDGRGRVVLVQFMATWCVPCLQQQPALEELRARYGDQGLSVVWVGMDLEGARVLVPFADGLAPSWPVLLADQPLREGQTLYGLIRELPTTVLLARDGRAVQAWSGLASPARIAPLIEEALAE
jgi:thiol-disulfide isomerase/thioredoxin